MLINAYIKTIIKTLLSFLLLLFFYLQAKELINSTYLANSFAYVSMRCAVALMIFLPLMGVQLEIVIKTISCILLLIYFFMFSYSMYQSISFFDPYIENIGNIEREYLKEEIIKTKLAFYLFFFLFNVMLYYLSYKLIIVSKKIKLWQLSSLLIIFLLCVYLLELLNYWFTLGFIDMYACVKS